MGLGLRSYTAPLVLLGVNSQSLIDDEKQYVRILFDIRLSDTYGSSLTPKNILNLYLYRWRLVDRLRLDYYGHIYQDILICNCYSISKCEIFHICDYLFMLFQIRSIAIVTTILFWE